MSRPRVVCFDLDDTLVSEADYVESGLRAAGALLDRELPGPAPAGEALVRRWRETRGRALFQEWLEARGADPAAWLPRLVAAYRGHLPRLALRPGALEALQAVVARGDRLALLSDGWLESQRQKWRALALALPFAPVVFTDARGREFWKPHPWGFEQVMAAHPDADGFCYVADNPAKDFQAPLALGWRAVLLRHAENLHPAAAGPAPALEAASFAEVLALTA
ncbi:HAD family hydrolase [Anaeromyxobacter paludicola]|uniref:Haloacid dehalogenase n=1 Tax=Anaeromyxobacter paludicola TaxID=2918171 RepID=A0ABM7X9J6_9BACT|nr:HAD family hydrolase [Anaeromyxobacter paludicola]BDG08528.1 haloacid dehalogenase [Anaeromyxobacter paludicola]